MIECVTGFTLAFALVSVGCGIYLLGTRVFLRARRGLNAFLRTLLVVATFFIGRLHEVLSPHEYLSFVTAWVIGCAALASVAPGPDARTGDPPAPGRS